MAISDGSVAHDACKCVCDGSIISDTYCAGRLGSNNLPMVYEEASCSCVDADEPVDECADGRTVDQAATDCANKQPGHWKFSKGARDANGKYACDCIEYCPDDVTTIVQARDACDADAGNQVCGTDPTVAYRFDLPHCTCVKPACKRQQCVGDAISDILGNAVYNRPLNADGNDIAGCYNGYNSNFPHSSHPGNHICKDVTNSTEQRKCFKAAIVEALTGNGVPDRINIP